MAIVCLSENIAELKTRLGKVVVAYTYDKKPVTAADLKVHGAMAAVLKDTMKPNLVQTLEGTPAFVHGGPFANIAHGCNSIIATKLAMRLSEFTVTEAGFGADLGAEKFIDIKCRHGGISPSAMVLVATIRALKMHGGVAKDNLKEPNAAAVEKGIPNLIKHLENCAAWGLPCVVAINHFATDTDEEVAVVERACEKLSVRAVKATHFADGGAGAIAVAQEIVRVCGECRAQLQFTYPLDIPLWDKVKTVAQKIYGADDIAADTKVRQAFRDLEAAGYGGLPVCIAKTQYSFSTDPLLRGRPKGFDVPIREVRLSAGAGFVVVITGDIMTMPGLPKQPCAEIIDIDENGEIVGLS